ncbi:hypothetical protein BRI6_4347 [plant metagenome]|uniref:TIGR03757 family integrating conjugative element protein n=1 Tax=plant metagenome TaxID=1297885 RepID=A0A484YC50_9ZZZZ
MRTPIRFVLRVPILLVLLAAATSAAAEVWVITDAQHPVMGAEAATRVIALDAAQRIEAELSAQLPTDPQHAATLVQQRLNQGGTALQQRLREAYQGVTDAWSLGVTTVPAVVVDQRYVVYGETRLDRALARVAQYRKEHP